MPVKLSNSRPATPHDFSAFLAPQTLLLMIGLDQMNGTFRGLPWFIRRSESGGRWNVIITVDGETLKSGFPSMAEAFQTVYVSGIRLGKDD